MVEEAIAMNDSRIEFDFTGDLANLMVEFILHKRALGYNYSSQALMLRSFSIFSKQYEIPDECKLPQKMVSDWIERRPNESPQTQERRIINLRKFALFLKERDYKVYVPVVPQNVDHSSFTPYIFNQKELLTIFKTSDNLIIRKHPLSNMKIVFPVLVRMLYGCGLRISESINLLNVDVNLSKGILTIKNSKGEQDRLVPMSDSLNAICNNYFNKTHKFSNKDTYFFAKLDGSQVNSSTVYKRFRDVLWKSGIPHGGKGKGPRLHDLRHSFAVHSLKMQSEKGLDLYCSLPILSTYLGHKSVTATEKYVRLTQEMYPDLIKKVSNVSEHVIPKVSL